eukprot:9332020-Alexandrium_andersonii.AAC.1
MGKAAPCGRRRPDPAGGRLLGGSATALRGPRPEGLDRGRLRGRLLPHGRVGPAAPGGPRGRRRPLG